MHAHIHIHIHVHVCMYAHVYIHVHPWDQCVGQFLLFHCFCKFTCYSVLASWSQFSFFLYWCIIIVCLINSYRRVGTCLKSLVFTRSLERNGCFQQHKMLLNLQKVVPAYCKCVPLCECSRWSWLSSYVMHDACSFDVCFTFRYKKLLNCLPCSWYCMWTRDNLISLN